MARQSILSVSLCFLFYLPAFLNAGTSGQQIIKASGVKGGLVVCVGCEDLKLPTELKANDAYIVHGLDTEAENVHKARQYIESRGLHGPVSAATFDGKHLPYVDNLVNLIVVSNAQPELKENEIQRVLAPRGVLLSREDALDTENGKLKTRSPSGLEGWVCLVKPWPASLDEWTHFLHDASGNAVSKDKRVGHPHGVRWKAGPKRSRYHDALASMSAMTSSGGRIFYIYDEGHVSLVHRPSKWKLVARDGFNGVLLWKRDIPSWVTHLHYFRTGPLQMPRRLVSVGDRVYVTCGLEAPVSKLDAATGKTLHKFKNSENTEEIIYHRDVLLTVRGDPSLFNREAPKKYGYWQLSVNREPEIRKTISAYRAGNGSVMWKKTGENLAHIVPLSLCAYGDRAFYLDNKNLHCLQLENGKELWKASFPTEGLFLVSYAPTVVAYDDAVLCLKWNRLCAFSIKNGKKLWERNGALGFGSPGDLFGIDGLAWSIPMTAAIWRGNKLDRRGRIRTGIPIPREEFLGNGGKEMWGMDVHTGEVKKSLPRSLLPGGHHHRCYRNKATERYLICGRRGLEYIDLVGDNHVNNWWARGMCQYGVMPANGYTYVPPDPCRCFNFIKINGFFALSTETALEKVKTGQRPNLEKGPAYSSAAMKAPRNENKKENQTPEKNNIAWKPPVKTDPQSWPTYRCDITRSGSAGFSMPAKLKVLWKSHVGDRISPSVAAGGRLFVSDRSSQTIHCIDANTGRPVWKFPAGGPVDSPPTIYEGLCVFGCADGSLYCLKASNGKLIWRFTAAPVDRRVVSDSRVESVWPVHGSVLIQEETVYFAAGRSSYLDGGIQLYGLDVYSGRKLYETKVSSSPVYPGKRGAEGTGALPAVLVSDGTRINMRQVQFDKKLNKYDKAELKTLIATTGFLEDCWFHRQNWVLGWPGKINSHRHPGAIGTQRRTGPRPFGKLVVFNEKCAYGVLNRYTWLKRTRSMYPPDHDGHFHQKFSRYSKDLFPTGVKIYARENKPGRKNRKWVVDLDFQPRAMLLAGDVLFTAGWRDKVVIKERTGRPVNPFKPDPRPSFLRAFSTARGKEKARYELDNQPVFDGISAAYGKLFISLEDGTIVCMGGK